MCAPATGETTPSTSRKRSGRVAGADALATVTRSAYATGVACGEASTDPRDWTALRIVSGRARTVSAHARAQSSAYHQP